MSDTNTRFIDKDLRTVRGKKQENKMVKFARNSFEAFKKGINKKSQKHLAKKETDLKQEYENAYQVVENIAVEMFNQREKNRIPLEVAMNDLSKIGVKLVDIELKKRLREDKKSKVFRLNSSTLTRILVNTTKKIVGKSNTKESYKDSSDRLYTAARKKENTMNAELDRLKDYTNYSSIFREDMPKQPKSASVISNVPITKEEQNINSDNNPEKLVNSSDDRINIPVTAIEKPADKEVVEEPPVFSSSLFAGAINSNNTNEKPVIANPVDNHESKLTSDNKDKVTSMFEGMAVKKDVAPIVEAIDIKSNEKIEKGSKTGVSETTKDENVVQNKNSFVASLEEKVAKFQEERKRIDEELSQIAAQQEKLLKEKERLSVATKTTDSEEKNVSERLMVARLVSEGFGLEEILNQVPTDERIKYARIVGEVEMQMRHSENSNQNTQKKA